ncbi:hypothetical protein F5148DRAFT_1289542 [Russula earlei]|uniref:Uncharacterized protein n=1 Tax=Russula earlei TaxID=71964 RepID=A0ACC0TXC9_9AGAM|nr:hypothetical protein F5148DRAFT_1289542 [Russula earlei]
MDTSGSNLQVKYSFASGATGNTPMGTLTPIGTKMYGVTQSGGANSAGVIFSFDTTTSTYTKLYDFNATNGSLPVEGLCAGYSNGKLYGITSAGGANGKGVIYSFDPSSGTYAKLYDMATATGASSNGTLTLYNNKFYGLTLSGGTGGQGVLFCFDPATNAYTVIRNYSSASGFGLQAAGRMIVANGILYGVSAGGDNGLGQLFSYNDAGSVYTNLFAFTGSQYEPLGIVLYNNVLYGVTYEGGAEFYGGVFSFDPATSAYHEIMSFTVASGGSSLGNIMVCNNKLMGIGATSIYQVTPNGTYTDVQDFTASTPPLAVSSFYGTLLLASSPALPPKLWGMTSNGGTGGSGAIFSMDTSGSNLQVKYSFIGAAGNTPMGTLTAVGTKLYGVTQSGGVNSDGVIFSFDTATGTYTKLYDFNATNGTYPIEGLCAGYSNGKLYGITSAGGANGKGVIYSFDPSSGTYAKLYDMATATGASSNGTLTLYNNKLYGLTLSGGTSGQGVLFCFDPATNAYTVIRNYSSASAVGLQAAGRMVVANGILYGVSAGGDNGLGQLFSYNDAGSVYTNLFAFTGSQYEPLGIVLYNNVLYGVTYEGGAEFYGGVFSFDPATSAYHEIMSFTVASGGSSLGNIMVCNNKLMGIGSMSIYQVTPNGTFTDVQDFTASTPPLGVTTFYGTLLLQSGGAAAQPTMGQTIYATTIKTVKTYGDASFTLGDTASSGLPVTYTSSDRTVATVTGSTIKIVGAGTCVITVSQTGNSTYFPAPDVTDTLIVNKAPLLITADNKTVNQQLPLPVLTAHYVGFVNGDTASSLVTLPVLSTASTSSPQGNYPITISGAASPNYDISYANGVLTIIGQLQVLQLIDSASRTYGDPDFQMVSSNSGLPVTYSIDSSDIAVVSATDTTQIHITGAGTTRVIARQTGNTTWGVVYDTLTLTINKAPLTITANDTSSIYGQPIPPFTATYSGLVYGETVPAIFTVPPVLIATNPETPPYPGIYQIQIGNAVARNYALTYINGIFTVSASGDSINVYCSSPHQLAANVMSAKARKATFALYSLDGRQVLTADVSLSSGLNYLSFPANLASGIYIARLKGEDMKLSQKVMVNKKYLVGLLLGVLSINGACLYAQQGEVNIATSAVPFLSISPDAKAGGMGDAGIATAADERSVFYNRAQLPFAEEKNNAGITYTPWMHDVANDVYLLSASGYHRIGDRQAISAGIRYFNVGQLAVKDFSGNNVFSTNPYELSVDLGYSRKLSQKLALAVALRYISSHLVSGSVNGNTYQAGNAVAGDVSLSYNAVDTTSGGFSVGLVVSNLGSKISYTSNADQKNFLPANLGLGFGYTSIWEEVNSLTIGVDINHLLVPLMPGDVQGLKDYYNQGVMEAWGKSFNNHQYTAGIGAEYAYRHRFLLRVGYKGSLSQNTGVAAGITAGCGVHLDSRYDIDLSYFSATGSSTTQSPLNNALRLGFNMAF